MLSAVLRTIREHHLIAAGDCVLVAFSGGPDSTALLHALATLAPRLGFSVRAACIDHGLRPESADEAATVGRRSHALGVDCDVIKVDVAAAKKKHGSLQAAARDARLAALEAAAILHKCEKIALGHTADDQAETVLFRVVRGTGVAGLAGIPYQRDRFIRPLLDLRRRQILAYVHKRKLDYVSDPSNANRRFARSRIRHDVLPSLAKENPRIVDALVGLARDAQAGTAGAWRSALPHGLYLSGRTLRLIEGWVTDSRGTRSVSVPGGAIVVTYGHVAFVPQAAPSEEETVTERGVEGPGCYRLLPPPALGIQIASSSVPPGPTAAAFDRTKLLWPLRLRSIRPGDRMAPRGGRGSRKLSDLLIDAKTPRRERAMVPVLCDASGAILFVPGLRPSECGRPSDETRDWIEVRVLR